jgi:2-polyprenyl-3-methyl-5-hydroxy-6-metoxy-1,4-benzoquinol methylase
MPPRQQAVSTDYEGRDLEALAEIPRYQNWLLEPFRTRLKGRILEVGAGIGNLAEQYVDDADEAVLLEPAENLAARLQSRFANRAHVRTIGRPLEEAVADFAPASFDACILVNVLEHVEDDGAMLRRLRTLLKASGSLLLFVPALSALYGTLDSVHHHYRRYTKASLRSAVEGQAFAVRLLRYFDVLGVIPWFVAGRILRQSSFNERAVRLYDRLVVPVGARLERLWSPPLGKNLICVAEPDSNDTKVRC